MLLKFSPVEDLENVSQVNVQKFRIWEVYAFMHAALAHTCV